MTISIDSQVVAFTMIAGLLTMTPGADTVLVIRNVMGRGRQAGLLTTLGSSTGVFIHAILSALGLSLILVQSATAFEILKMIGAGYLIWLGIRSLTQALRGQQGGLESMGHPEPPLRPARGRRSFLEGLLSNVTNPKAAMFYLAFLPQFIRPGEWVLGKSVLLAGIHWTENVIWLSIVTLLLARVRSWIILPRVKRGIEATTGAILIAFGARLAMDRAR